LAVRVPAHGRRPARALRRATRDRGAHGLCRNRRGWRPGARHRSPLRGHRLRRAGAAARRGARVHGDLGGARRGRLRRVRLGNSRGRRSPRRLAQRPPHASHALAQLGGRKRPDDGRRRARIRLRLRRLRGVLRAAGSGSDLGWPGTTSGGPRFRPRGGGDRVRETGAHAAPARGARRRGVSDPSRRLNRDFAVLRGRGALRRHAHRPRLPLRRCRGRAAGRTGGGRLDLDARYHVAAALDRELLGTVLKAQERAEPPPEPRS
jgi:hypothetical protein